MRFLTPIIVFIFLSFCAFAQQKNERLIAHSQRTIWGTFIVLSDSVEFRYPTIYSWSDPINNPIQLGSFAIGHNKEIEYEDFGQLGWKKLKQKKIIVDSSTRSSSVITMEVNFVEGIWDTTDISTQYLSSFERPKLSYVITSNRFGKDTASKVIQEYDTQDRVIWQQLYAAKSLVDPTQELQSENTYKYQNDRLIQRTGLMLNSQSYISQIWNWDYNEERNGHFTETFLYNTDSTIIWLNGSYKEYDDKEKITYDAELKRSASAQTIDTINVVRTKYERTFDQNNNILSEIKSTKLNELAWEFERMDSFKYNANNKIVESKIYIYSKNENKWIPASKETTEFNTNDLPKKITYYSYSSADYNFRPTAMITKEYTSFGNIRVNQNWGFDTSKSAFVFNGSDNYYYETYFAENMDLDNKNLINSAVYPNPFNTNIKFVFEAITTSKGIITITDLNGSTIDKIYFMPKIGINNIVWFNNDLPTGIYFAELKIDNKFKSFKLLKQ